MNKRANTLLFVLGATLFNIIVTLLFFIALLALYANSLMSVIPEEGQTWAFPLIFMAAIGLSFVIYRLVLKILLKKVDVEKYFDPIFKRQK